MSWMKSPLLVGHAGWEAGLGCLRCDGPGQGSREGDVECCGVVRLLGGVLGGSSEVCWLGWGWGEGGSSKTVDQGQSAWTVWGCSTAMVGDCFISRIHAKWRKGVCALHGVGWWPLCLNQDAFAELHAGSILTAYCLQSPYLMLGVAWFCEWFRSSPIYTVWCFPGLRLSLFSNLQLFLRH